MRISELYNRGKPAFSFEFFPPKTDAGFRTLFGTIEDLKRLDPGFVSVTMGAGGSTRSKTVDLVIRIQQEIGITAMAHLPCIGFEREQVGSILEQLQAGGIENVLALRGDPPKDAADFTPPSDGFGYANDLIRYVHEADRGFCVAGACYPETHPEAPNTDVDFENLQRKVDDGAQVLISQLFFDNEKFFDFMDRVRAAGIEVPVVPGIMPITSVSGVRRMTGMCGCEIPAELNAELEDVAEDDDATHDLGVRWATGQCRELLDRGVPGIHFYTLNKSTATREIFDNLVPRG
jgi:methylenetetrahydrofolate reductase (NADPH)